MGVNSLPKTVTRQRRDCDLNPGTSAPESSTLTTRLPSHPRRLDFAAIMQWRLQSAVGLQWNNLCVNKLATKIAKSLFMIGYFWLIYQTVSCSVLSFCVPQSKTFQQGQLPPRSPATARKQARLGIYLCCSISDRSTNCSFTQHATRKFSSLYTNYGSPKTRLVELSHPQHSPMGAVVYDGPCSLALK